MASSSSSAPSRKPKYEVFLSFRGEDTRNTFISHLHSALQQRGILTFFDENNLKHGQSISPELVKAIEESKFAIIVFSKNYASSTWCLDELVKIMGCRAKHGLTVIPIFYDVDPSDVRKQKNSFAESFARHEVNFKDKVRIWKKNLFEAGYLAGVDVRGKNEASCIKTIAKAIFNKLPQKAFTKGLVGIESRLTKLRSLASKNPNEVCFLGIWGMGGIGKTTIGRAFFYELIGEFQGRGCFLQDVSKRDMVSLQEMLLKKVLNETVEISDAYEGSMVIRDRLHSARVLLVLDDVNDVMQIKSLAGDRDWFGVGSRIIITTRDKHLLEDVDYEPYEVNLLCEIEAMRLFCSHAFRKDSPVEDFVSLSRRVVSYAAGLPLALQVLGCHLHGRGLTVWESALRRLKDDPEDKIFVALKISFDGLNDSQRRIFLDVACFFRGKHVDDVKRKLDAFCFHPEEGINVLIQKSLLRVQESDFDYKAWWILNGRKCISYGAIEMHDLIQEMGWHIVRQEANKQLERYTRLWLQDDIIHVLKDKKATCEIEAVVLNQIAHMINLREGAFENMNRLRLLEIHCREVRGSPNCLPNTLQWLHWVSYPHKSLSKEFKPSELVGLELPSSHIEQTPDFSAVPNLEVINLSNCKRLLEVHPSIGKLKKLVQLLLRSCSQLKRLPRIIQTEVLEILDLEYCEELENIPDNINCCSRLQFLYLSSCSKLQVLPDLPRSIKELDLDRCRVTRMPNLVHLLGKLKDLHRLSLWCCWNGICHGKAISTFPQRLPNFLLPFWDWGSVSKTLWPRKEMLIVYVPGEHKIPDWFTTTTKHSVTISLAPFAHDDGLAGLAIYCITSVKLHCATSNSQSSDDRGPLTLPRYAHAAFMYIPIGKITIGRGVWQELKDNQRSVFEITSPSSSGSSHPTWAFRLVYRDEPYYKDSPDHFKVTIHCRKDFGGSTLRLCIGSQEY